MFFPFLSRERKGNEKKPPVSRFILRVVDAAGARGNSPACAKATASSDSPRALIRLPRRCSARDKGGIKNQQLKTIFKHFLRRTIRTLPLCGRSL
jgi:hypothetical protein